MTVQSIGTQAEFLVLGFFFFLSSSSLVFPKNLLINTMGKNLRGHAVDILLLTNENVGAKKDLLKFKKQDGLTRWQGIFSLLVVKMIKQIITK